MLFWNTRNKTTRKKTADGSMNDNKIKYLRDKVSSIKIKEDCGIAWWNWLEVDEGIEENRWNILSIDGLLKQ